MTPLLLAAALTCTAPTLECAAIHTRDQADQWIQAETQQIPPTWFISQGWATLPAVAPVRVSTQSPASPPPVPGPAPAVVEAAIRATFPEDPERALTVAFCESGYQTGVISRTRDYGLFQINKKVHEHGIVAALGYTMDDMLTLEGNLAVARSLYNGSGWGPWYMSSGCWS